MYNYIWFTGVMGVGLLTVAIITLMKEMVYCERHGLQKLKTLIPNGLLVVCSIGWFVLTICLYLSIQNQI
ncbi:hypothetical protein [Enterococcus sp. AZ196]|uniref:hypothetical protein n=1 Tax=Enterococcus sp. AZ196 TaxID=2774659 RepID=UPI003D2B6662